jgi:hypothetical protein
MASSRPLLLPRGFGIICIDGKIATDIYAFSAEKRTIVEELVEEIPGGRPVLK